MKILYLSADLRNVGPTRQTLNIIKYSGVKESCIVLTLFDEPEASLIDLYKEENITVESLHLHRKLFIFSAVKKIASYCKNHQIDVIHSNGVKPDIIAHFAAKKAGVKHIITLRNFPMEDLSGRMNPWIGKIIAQFHLFALKRCKYLVACSKTIADKMRKTYGVNIEAIQNGVDTQIYNTIRSAENPYKNMGIDENAKIFICTNSFIPRKHNDDIAEAFVTANLDNAHLIFLGDGFLFEEVKNKYKQYPNIHFLGKKKNVVPFLQNADIFVSASDSEGLPNAVLEAIACGCHVILSDIPQHREIVNELQSCGEIFPLRQIDAICEKMQNAINLTKSEHVIEQLAESPFTMKNMGGEYGEYYHKLGLEF